MAGKPKLLFFGEPN